MITKQLAQLFADTHTTAPAHSYFSKPRAHSGIIQQRLRGLERGGGGGGGGMWFAVSIIVTYQLSLTIVIKSNTLQI